LLRDVAIAPVYILVEKTAAGCSNALALVGVYVSIARLFSYLWYNVKITLLEQHICGRIDYI
jgi:hypothetical protein